VSSLADRLRGVIRPGGASGASVQVSDDADPTWESPSGGLTAGSRGAALRADPAEVLGGEWRESRGQQFLVIDRKYSPGYRHGRVAVADSLPPPDGLWPRLSLLAGTACRGRMLFVDLETTGLAGGAGSYAFLVGCGWFDGALFRVRQFFLSSFAGERVLLEAVAEAAAAAGTVVTYNGKSFDLPLMETRFVLHRMETPFAGMPHVDMVHPARRLWRPDESATDDEGVSRGVMVRTAGNCRLTTLEETLCGHIREGDVPGFEIPSRYFHFVRSGDARALEAVMEHNRLDLLALALVTARASQLLDDGPDAATTGREALGMGRLYERAGLDDDARAAFTRAAQMPGADTATRAEALRGVAVMARRMRRYDEAASAWRRILELRGCPAPVMREATDALAVHHEHRVRDLRAAQAFALQSMTLQQSRSRREAVEHRLARLNRKLGDAASSPMPLF
jgi:uncharacterized protein YprB with RNaseH-like and TPR domain